MLQWEGPTLVFTVNPAVKIDPESAWCQPCPRFCQLFADPLLRVKTTTAPATAVSPVLFELLPLLEEFFDETKLSSREDLQPLQQAYRQEVAKRQNEGCTQCELGALRAQFTRQVLSLIQPPLAMHETRPT